MVWHPGRKLLFAVSDNGRLHAIGATGNVRSTWKGFGDAEGVTYGHGDGPYVYIVRERPTTAILEFDVDTEKIHRVFELGRWIRPDAPNQGAEAITFVPDDEGGAFYVGVQDGTIHVFRLPPDDGESSEVVFEVADRMALVQLMERQGAQDAELDAELEAVTRQMREEKKNAQLASWIASRRGDLLDAGQITVNLDGIR